MDDTCDTTTTTTRSEHRYSNKGDVDINNLFKTNGKVHTPPTATHRQIVHLELPQQALVDNSGVPVEVVHRPDARRVLRRKVKVCVSKKVRVDGGGKQADQQGARHGP